MSFSISVSTSTPRAVMASTPTRCVTSPCGTRPLACGLPWVGCVDILSPPPMATANKQEQTLSKYNTPVGAACRLSLDIAALVHRTCDICTMKAKEAGDAHDDICRDTRSARHRRSL